MNFPAAALPALPEFLALLLARGKLFEVDLVERPPQSYEQPDQALAWSAWRRRHQHRARRCHHRKRGAEPP